MRYEDVIYKLQQTPKYDNKPRRTDRDCERKELLGLLKRQEKLETEVGCLNRRNLDNTKLADAWTKNWLGNGLNLYEVAQTQIVLLAHVKDEATQSYAIDLLKLVVKKDTNPITFKQMGIFGVTEQIMKYIIKVSAEKAGRYRSSPAPAKVEA